MVCFLEDGDSSIIDEEVESSKLLLNLLLRYLDTRLASDI